jgi:3-deoxy-D-manno-octulosonic-acid transferase
MLLYRRLRFGRYRQGWSQRFGRIDRKDPAKKCIWIHAVSLGEINAARSVIDQLAARFPGYEIAISTTTDTGNARAIALFGTKHNVFYFPLDFSWVMARAFDRIKPDICLLMELEVWYNYTHTAFSRNIPIVVVNGRLSAKSFSRYRFIKNLIRPMFDKLTLVLAQTDDYARRFIYLGCRTENVIVSGSLKYDTAVVADKIDGADAVAAQLGLGTEPVFVAGGTGDDEEAVVLDAFKKIRSEKALENVRLILVPRKPERFDQVANLIAQNGFDCVRYSLFKQADTPAVLKPTSVILGDTMGDLRKFYSLASVIFVGRSLVPMGGSDMMEAAALGRCTIFGPHAFNFQQTVEALLSGNGAILVNNGNELADAVTKCLLDPAMAKTIASNGQAVIKANQGATAITVNEISKHLGSNTQAGSTAQ